MDGGCNGRHNTLLFSSFLPLLQPARYVKVNVTHRIVCFPQLVYRHRVTAGGEVFQRKTGGKVWPDDWVIVVLCCATNNESYCTVYISTSWLEQNVQTEYNHVQGVRNGYSVLFCFFLPAGNLSERRNVQTQLTPFIFAFSGSPGVKAQQISRARAYSTPQHLRAHAHLNGT